MVQVLWRHEVFRGIDGVAGVIFEYDSPAGEEGFPGSLAVKVYATGGDARYRNTRGGEILRLRYDINASPRGSF